MRKARKPEQAPEPPDYTTPEMVGKLKSIDFIPSQVIVSGGELAELISIIRALSAEIETLRALVNVAASRPPVKAKK